MRELLLKKEQRVEMILFMILVAMVALGNGLSDSVYSNYFKEVYDVTTFQRGLIEFPRELPGVVCAFVIAFMSVWGDVKTALLAQGLSIFGVAILGIFTPSFVVMCFFLFVASLGMHVFLPLQDAIGMELAEPDRVGERMGQYASVKAFFSFVAGVIVFVGFRYGFLSFSTDTKWVFMIAVGAFVVAFVTCIALLAKVKMETKERKKVKLFFRKEYKYYYFLTILHGVQKQIALVYGSWVVVDLLLKGADIMALLILIASFICVFFMRAIGGWIDRFGIKVMMFVDALSFIFVYVIYGCVVWGISQGFLPNEGISVMVVYVLFILDRMSMQIGMVKSVYLRSIALNPTDITPTLSTGTSLDHIVAIIAAIICGYIWTNFGSHWVFFLAATFSLGNLYVAFQIDK